MSSVQVRVLFCGVSLGLLPTAFGADLLGSVALRQQWGGCTSGAVAIVGDLAYCGMGPRFGVLDISDPTMPVRLWQSEVLPGFPFDIAIKGDYAYIAASYGGFIIMDLRNPVEPKWIAHRPAVDGYNAVCVHEHWAFLVDWEDVVHVYDVADPTNPRLVTVMPLLGHGHFGIGLMWPYLYVTTWYEIEILDVTNPLAPIRVGVYTAPVFPYDFEIVDGLMYLADWTNGMMIVDLAQPAAPQQIASFPTTTWTDWLHVVGDRAYVVDYQGLTIVDVSNPFAPTTLGHVPSVGSSGYQRFDVKAGIACVPSYYAGIYLIDVSDPTAPASIGRYAEINHSEYITVSGSYAYTSGYTPGIRVVNLDAAGGPSQVREISGVRSTQLRVEGDRLCAASTEGITVYDIQSPDSPTALFSTPTEGTASDLVLEGPLIYTAERSAGLCIYDRSDPQQLVRIGQLPAPDPNSSAVGVAVSGDYAYVASYWEGLRVIDVSAPTEPQLVTVCPVGAQAMDVVVSGAHAYVSVRWDGVAVVDISDPLRPFVVARMPEFSDMLRIQSDLLYAGGSSQFSIYDISHPAAPLKLLTSSTPGYATSLEPQGNTLYVAAAHAGIAVYAVFRPGDLNCDGALDMFDIDPFVRAFAGEPAYGAAFPDCRWLSGDCNGDGNVTFADIDPFVSLLLRYHRPTR